MITKGIIEQVINEYSVKVRIPFFNKIANVAGATPTEDLYTAAICALPNTNMNYQVNDIVFVGFEDHQESQPVILGYLAKESGNNKSASITANSIYVNDSAQLPESTYIGNISATEISYLKGLNKNLQLQLEILEQRIAKLEEVNNSNEE